jgi:hypothetical protein
MTPSSVKNGREHLWIALFPGFDSLRISLVDGAFGFRICFRSRFWDSRRILGLGKVGMRGQKDDDCSEE